jgi:glutamine synthetase
LQTHQRRLEWFGNALQLSTDYLREVGGKDYFLKLMAAFEKNRAEHIAVYGPDNEMRLTGLHETASIDSFSSWRGRPGRLNSHSHSFMEADYRGYLEDRRPNSQGDPYAIASQILKTIAEVPTS